MLLDQLWRRIGSGLQWRILWMRNDTFMVGVSGLIFDPEGKILLLKHRFWTNQQWGLPTGYMEKQETFEEALAREVREETGIILPNKPQVISFKTGFKLRVEVAMTTTLEQDFALHLDPKEILDGGFYAHDALPTPILPSHLILIQKFTKVPQLP